MGNADSPDAVALAETVAGEMTAGAYLTVLRALDLARAEGAERDRRGNCPRCGQEQRPAETSEGTAGG